jgi:hypothetical protein
MYRTVLPDLDVATEPGTYGEVLAFPQMLNLLSCDCCSVVGQVCHALPQEAIDNYCDLVLLNTSQNTVTWFSKALCSRVWSGAAGSIL